MYDALLSFLLISLNELLPLKTPRSSPRTNLQNLLTDSALCFHSLTNLMLPLAMLCVPRVTDLTCKKSSFLFVWVIDSDDPRESEWLLFCGGRKAYVWVRGDSSGTFAGFMPYSKSYWKMTATKRSQPQWGSKVGGTLVGKTKLAEALKEKKTWNEGWREEMINVCYRLMTTYKNKAYIFSSLLVGLWGIYGSLFSSPFPSCIVGSF